MLGLRGFLRTHRSVAHTMCVRNFITPHTSKERLLSEYQRACKYLESKWSYKMNSDVTIQGVLGLSGRAFLLCSLWQFFKCSSVLRASLFCSLQQFFKQSSAIELGFFALKSNSDLRALLLCSLWQFIKRSSALRASLQQFFKQSSAPYKNDRSDALD